MPQLPVHDLSRVIGRFEPDILHLSAHGTDNSIILSNDAERERPLSVEQFLSILDGVERKPRLIFVSACKSHDVAQKLSSVVEFAIGATGSISVAAAREAAVKFYELLAKGFPVGRAFNAAAAIVRIEDIGIDLKLYERTKGSAETVLLAEPMRLLAAFAKVEEVKDSQGRANALKLSNSDGELAIELGVAGCPDGVRQVVMFLDVEPTVRAATTTCFVRIS